ncbi:MAG: hypothetical protein ACOC1I_07440 [Spirochaetota bacterium]
MHRRSDSGSARLGRATLALVVAVAAFAACSPPETDPDARRAPDGSALYQDGRYAASFSHTGPDGWRPFLQLRIRTGLVQEICFDAIKADGSLLSDDAVYLERYRLDHGVELLPYFNDLIAHVLASQAPFPRIDYATVSWGVRFHLLVKTALESAEVGLTLDAAGIEQIPTEGPFLVSDEPDELGWRGELVLVFGGDGVVAGHYRETREEPDGSRRVKRDDEAYQELFVAASGVRSEQVAATLVDRLIAGSSNEIDGVSGATLSSARFIALARKIESQRVAAALPNNLCR